MTGSNSKTATKTKTAKTTAKTTTTEPKTPKSAPKTATKSKAKKVTSPATNLKTKQPAQAHKSKSGLVCLIVILVVAALVASGLVFLNVLLGPELSDSTNNEAAETEEVVANCDVLECVQKIEVTTPIEEITEIIGVEPEKSDYQERYTWKLNKKESIAMTKSGSESYILQATIDKERIANEQVDMSIFTELKKLLENGTSFTYEELVEKMGGIEGTLDGKTSTSNSYIWVDKNGQTLSATFSDYADGKCSIASLR